MLQPRHDGLGDRRIVRRVARRDPDPQDERQRRQLQRGLRQYGGGGSENRGAAACQRGPRHGGRVEAGRFGCVRVRQQALLDQPGKETCGASVGQRNGDAGQTGNGDDHQRARAGEGEGGEGSRGQRVVDAERERRPRPTVEPGPEERSRDGAGQGECGDRDPRQSGASRPLEHEQSGCDRKHLVSEPRQRGGTLEFKPAARAPEGSRSLAAHDGSVSPGPAPEIGSSSEAR